MKPDGVITAALEPMETLESNPVNELCPVTGQQPSQGAAEEAAQRPKDAVPPGPEKPKESSSAKTSNKISGDPKAKTATKTAQKTKPSATNVTKSAPGSRLSTTSAGRLSNGLSKPQSNGVTKKTAPALEKKSTPTSAAPKKPTAGVPAPRNTAKVTERKTASSATQGAKSAVGAAAIKKATTSATVNGVKTGAAAAAKKPPAPKPATATSTKSTTALKTDKPPLSKTRPSTGTTASRPTTGSTRPPSTIATKSPAATSKPATPKTSATGANSVATKSASSTPSAVKTPASQTSRNTTPAKKDVTKSATPAAKKSADSPLSRPSATLKSTRSEAPKPASKSDSLAKKPSVSKVADAKAPNRSKTQENKSTPSKDVAKTPASKTVASKNTSAKKTVGSSTPTPVKRGPKAEEAAETGGEIAAAVAAAAAIASAAATIVGSNESQSPAEVALVASQSATAEQMPPTIPSAFAVQGIISEPTLEPSTEQAYEQTPEIQQEKIPEPRQEPIRETAGEPMREPSPEPIPEPTPEFIREPTPEFIREPSPVPVREQTPEMVLQPTPEFIREPTPEPILQPSAESIREPTPQPVRELTPESQREQSPEPLRDSSPEPMGEFTPDAVREPTPEHALEITPQPLRALTPEPERDSSPELLQEITSDPTPEPSPEQASALTPEIQQEIEPETRREATPEPLREPTPEVLQDLPPEPVQDANVESLLESEPEPLRELTPEPVEEQPQLHACQMSPEVPEETFRQPTEEPRQGAAFSHDFQQPAQNDPFKFDQSASDSVPSLGTTVMSPPCSPPVPVSQIREFQDPSDLLSMHIRPDVDQTLEPRDIDPQVPHGMMSFPTGERNDQDDEWQTRRDEEDEEENLMTSAAPSAEAFYAMAQPPFLGASTVEDFTSGHTPSPHEKEVAAGKADEEINEDEEDEDEEDEEQRRLGHHLSSMITDTSTSQPSEEFQIRPSAFGASAGWHCDDLLSGMDSEDVSSCTSSRQQGISDFSSTQHTAILEGTQSSDALIDSSLRGSEGDGNFMGSPNVETLANEEDDEEDERVDDMDLSSERAEEHHHVFRQREQDEDEEDEDVEMHSDGVAESCENAEDDDFHQEARLDNLNRGHSPSVLPPTTSWGQTNPFSDTWAQPQPASLRSVSSPSPISDHGAGESESPTQSPARTGWDSSSSPFLAPLSGQDSERQRSLHGPDASVPEDTPNTLAPAAVGLSQSSGLSGTAPAARSGSETSTPEELRDYDSSSGVESRSDKQHTPVPASLQPDLEQDLGIHLEKGDGEEEEAETLPADEVLGTGPPTAPASAPSSPTTSVDEASDTEGEMQMNEADAPATADESAAFESPTLTCNLSALDEDEEVRETAAGEGEEDEGETTPQSANSVASYGFDCTTSNSNAHSTAESCGKSPGIFSLENEEQLPEEAKDPSLIKELTSPPPAAAAQAEDLLGRPVDLMPLNFPEDKQPGLDERHYMLGGELTAQHLQEVDPLEASLHRGPVESANTDENQPSYYSTICDKTDYLEGNV
ncbi:mucin-5AC [Hippocampus zosterae]|uniref:mucin-5AC n=1 Tax=Hippocampus zosterae TaxID=109293 RepID=UPI00223CEB6D|nr:mucin-5AC [Hippocampus zosterae]XP_051904723.1 mucin-5AC [Hippocampus zosterae]